MQPSKAIRNYVTLHITGLCNCLNLTHFHINVCFCDLKTATMDICPDYRYLEALINIDVETVTAMWKENKELILECLAHEISHLVTSEMSDPFATKCKRPKKETVEQIHFEERVTETVSRWALRLYKLENKL